MSRANAADRPPGKDDRPERAATAPPAAYPNRSGGGGVSQHTERQQGSPRKWRLSGWKPFGAGLVDAVGLRFLLAVLAAMAAYMWIADHPLHHLLGRETVLVVDQIVDGDTFTAHTPSGVSARFRLRLVDAPEHDQPFFKEARAMLSALLLDHPDREIVALLWEQDKWGRYIADVVVRDSIFTRVSFVQEELVKSGLAWYFGRLSGSGGALADAMEEAKRQKKGLWADDAPVEPWRHRHYRSQQGQRRRAHPEDAARSQKRTGNAHGHDRRRSPRSSNPVR